MTSTKGKVGETATALLRVLADCPDPLVAEWARLLLTHGESAAGTVGPKAGAGGRDEVRAHQDAHGHHPDHGQRRRRRKVQRR
jgi:hypothetical protein